MVTMNYSISSTGTQNDTILAKVINFLLYIGVFFPYINFFGVGFSGNLQPYSILFAVLFLFYNIKYLSWNVSGKLLFYVSIIVIIVLNIELLINYMYSPEKIVVSDVIQAVYFYISGFIFFLAYINLFKIYGINFKYIYIIFWIWIVVGLLQFFVDRTLFTDWINKLIISNDRGVVSLASEPSYFGRMLILFAILFFITKKYKHFFVAVISNVVLAQSLYAIGFMFATIYFLIESSKKRLMYISSFVILFIIAVPFLLTFDDFRVVYLLAEIIENPMGILDRHSLNYRLANVYYGITGFSFIPNGFTTWPSYFLESLSASQIFHMPLDHEMETLMIHGMLPRMLYEIGIFSVLILVSLYKMTDKTNWRLMIFLLIFMLFKFTHPFFMFVLAYMSYLSLKDQNELPVVMPGGNK